MKKHLNAKNIISFMILFGFFFLLFLSLCHASNWRQGFFLTTMQEEEIEGFINRYPALGERIPNWVVIGKIDDQVIVHVIMDIPTSSRLYQRSEYLGKSYKAIARKAKYGDQICRAVIKKIIFTTWEVDNPEPPPDKIIHRDSLGEWIKVGKPTRLSNEWYPAHVWFGHDIDSPIDSDIE